MALHHFQLRMYVKMKIIFIWANANISLVFPQQAFSTSLNNTKYYKHLESTNIFT